MSGPFVSIRHVAEPAPGGVGARRYTGHMPGRDPYEVLGVTRDASGATVRAAWRKLARNNHPDLARSAEAGVATRTMAEINAAYEELRDPDRRRRYDVLHPPQERPRPRAARATASNPFFSRDAIPRAPDGPPPPPPTRPVTAHLDTSLLFRLRNQTLSGHRRSVGHPVQDPRRGSYGDHEPPRASDPTGPIHRRTGRCEHVRRPSLEEARTHLLDFGRFHGRTLGEVADREPTYVDWLVRTINRDPELLAAARVVREDLDARGVVRVIRTPASAAAGARDDGAD